MPADKIIGKEKKSGREESRAEWIERRGEAKGEWEKRNREGKEKKGEKRIMWRKKGELWNIVLPKTPCESLKDIYNKPILVYNNREIFLFLIFYKER